MPAALRLIHPAPALAVTLLSGVLGAILLGQAGSSPGWRLLLTAAAVAGSQITTGAVNDLADQPRDAVSGRGEKPLPAGLISRPAAVGVAAAGGLLQVAASLPLGAVPLLLGLAALASAVAYDLWLSRTPLSALPYLVSFGLLPLWIATGIGVEVARVLPAVPLAGLIAAAAHLANTLRDFDADAATGSRSLGQLLGRRGTRLLAAACLAGCGLGVAAALLLGGAGLISLLLGVAGLVVVVVGSLRERTLWYAILVAAVAWTAAWALATG
ncbi:MAG TPA: UbiA family prenyltransferase [Candidatus Limnocylindria bacterium]|jgi:4-hydroxybenzoate polyprenyltransferase|nr:UbiA family prenyltransferase [Candidatus Limnocylindria bacterium]